MQGNVFLFSSFRLSQQLPLKLPAKTQRVLAAERVFGEAFAI